MRSVAPTFLRRKSCTSCSRPHMQTGELCFGCTRATLQKTDRCIDCKKPSKAQRCHACSRRAERNTDRYRGQQRRGPVPMVQIDIKDLGYAMQSLARAHAAWSTIPGPQANARERREALVEPRAQLDLARRFIVEVLARNVDPASSPRPRRRVRGARHGG